MLVFDITCGASATDVFFLSKGGNDLQLCNLFHALVSPWVSPGGAAGMGVMTSCTEAGAVVWFPVIEAIV